MKAYTPSWQKIASASCTSCWEQTEKIMISHMAHMYSGGKLKLQTLLDRK